MYNDDNNLSNNIQLENNNSNLVNNNQSINNDYQYQNNNKNTNINLNDNDNSKKIILIILISAALIGFGYFAYTKIFSTSNEKKEKLDNIIVENGVMSPKFSLDNITYTVEAVNDNIKFICKYKNDDVNIEGCNKKILINENKANEYKIKFNENEYIFRIVKINENAPIISEVTGNTKEWTKSVILVVNAIFNIDKNENSYSFDAGKTWQEENKKEFTKNDTISIMVRDKSENISTIYTEKIDKIDSKGPIINVTGATSKIVALTLKDIDSKVVAWTVTKNTNTPSSWTNIDLSSDIVIKYNATTTGTFYAWAKDYVGNITYKKFVIGKEDKDDDITTSEKMENIVINDISGNSDTWVTNVTLRINAESNFSDANLVYSFDGGKTYQNSNIKKITDNGNVSIVVKNNKTGKTSNIVNQEIKHIDSSAPICGSTTGTSTAWTKNARTIRVTCIDKGNSGCKNSFVEEQYNGTKKIDNLIISDNAGNKTLCPVNVYVDTTGPKLTVTPFVNEKDIVYKFQLAVEDNESGINIDTIKYKEKVLKNGVDNIWHEKWTDSKEISKIGDIYYNYRFTKETGIYKYFTISAIDNLGNITEIDYSI